MCFICAFCFIYFFVVFPHSLSLFLLSFLSFFPFFIAIILTLFFSYIVLFSLVVTFIVVIGVLCTFMFYSSVLNIVMLYFVIFSQHLNSGWHDVLWSKPHNQTPWEKTPSITGAITLKTQLQQENTNISNMGPPKNTQPRRPKGLHHWVPQKVYYIRPIQNWVAEQSDLIDRNNCKRKAKMGRQKNIPQVNKMEKSPERELK